MNEWNEDGRKWVKGSKKDGCNWTLQRRPDNGPRASMDYRHHSLTRPTKGTHTHTRQNQALSISGLWPSASWFLPTKVNKISLIGRYSIMFPMHHIISFKRETGKIEAKRANTLLVVYSCSPKLHWSHLPKCVLHFTFVQARPSVRSPDKDNWH